ncbi:hypothetical protein [Streptomyces sp. NPDC012888]|uniref:hypothetical protein n=1 Tax=Streptomyces sp. NPDC012888 TaxID=3364855 RepID=UPI0036BADCCD
MTDDDTAAVIHERGTEGKIRYASQKLIEIHDALINSAARDHRGALLGLAMTLDWVADAVKEQGTENARLRERLRKAERAADLLAADHRAIERAQAECDAIERDRARLDADGESFGDGLADAVARIRLVIEGTS